MAMRRKNRKTHMKRKTHRKGTRRNNTRRSHMRGGDIQGSNVGDSSMNLPYKVNTLQGQEYQSQHANQHGGVADYMPSQKNYDLLTPAAYTEARVQPPTLTQSGGVADVGYTGVLDGNLVEAARTGGTLASFQEIAGMKDQGGGGRRRKHRRNAKKSHKKGRKNGAQRKTRARARARTRRCWSGGSSPIDAPTLLLPVDMEKQAVIGMNPEWKLAENPTAFDPLK